MPPSLEEVQKHIQEAQKTTLRAVVRPVNLGSLQELENPRLASVRDLNAFNHAFTDLFDGLTYISEDSQAILDIALEFDRLVSRITQLVALPGDGTEEA